jgi:hypothetical protein
VSSATATELRRTRGGTLALLLLAEEWGCGSKPSPQRQWKRERGGPDRGKACGGTARRAVQQGHDMVRQGFPCELVGVGVWGTGAARPSCPSGRRGSDAEGAAAPCGGAHARPREWVFHSVYPCLTEICSKISNQTSKTLNSKLYSNYRR